VGLTVAIQRVAQLVTQEQMAVVVVDTDMVQMAGVSLETISPFTGKRARQQKCHGDLLQTMVEVTLTVSARSRKTTLRERITSSKSSMTSPRALLFQP